MAGKSRSQALGGYTEWKLYGGCTWRFKREVIGNERYLEVVINGGITLERVKARRADGGKCEVAFGGLE